MKFRIDRQKWLDAVKETIAARAKEPYRTCRYDTLTERLVKLYSIRAEGRGTVHRRRARLTLAQYAQLDGKKAQSYWATETWDRFVAAGGTEIEDLGALDQSNYIGDAWEEFARPEPASTSTPVEVVKQTVGVIR